LKTIPIPHDEDASTQNSMEEVGGGSSGKMDFTCRSGVST
jgi:hypothetical protein